MTYDLLIQGGTVVDGTGAPKFTADVAIKDGQIAGISAERGKLGSDAKRVIKADGLVVAPGVIDVHTHYDAQLCWDGTLSTSTSHGTTTVIQGNCGIGVAPCKPEHRDISMHDLVVLEGISYDTMKAGIPWDFQTFPEYLAYVQRRGLGINVAAFVPLGPLRRYELGDEANKRAATPEETTRIANALREAMKAGAFGFSSTMTKRQTGFQGKPLPTQLADANELKVYAGVLKELGRGVIQANVIEALAKPTEEELAKLDMLIDSSGGRTVTYSGAFYRADFPEAIEDMLQRCERLRKRGAVPQTTIMPMTIELDFRNAMALADVDAFKETLNRTVEEQKRIYADPAWRERAKSGLRSGPKLFGTAWPHAIVLRVKNPKSESLLKKTVTEVAALRGGDPFDVMIDLALENDLELKLLGSHANNDHKKLGQHIKDPRILVGLHDGGAHVDQMFQAGFPTYMLGHWVRDEKVIDLEYAVKRMTSEPADYMHMFDRGRVATGKRADLMIFDPATVGSVQPPELQLNDLPAGGTRLYARPTGMAYTLVAGVPVMENGKHTGAMPGSIVLPTA
jgi:N-acyl-D-amino-acid deacylase